jgi:hypothetical protein
VHALAAWRIFEVTRSRGLSVLRPRLEQLYPRLLAWHRYLASARDPGGSGLMLIYHPWESGTDNSPRWDSSLARLEIGELPAYQRHDLKHVEDPSERPTHFEYDRYLWLVELLKQAAYDDAAIQRSHPFQVRDVLMTAIFAAACEALVSLGTELGAPIDDLAQLTAWCRRSGEAVQNAWDADLCVALDWDVNAGQTVRVETCAGLAPLLVPDLSAELLTAVIAKLQGAGFAGAAGLAYPAVPSTVPGSPGFQPRSYWRGPSWPVANWLFWWAMRRHGQHEAAAKLRAANLALLDRPSAEFAEYFEPYTAEPLGSLEQSWTAAVALDWLAAEHYP